MEGDQELPGQTSEEIDGWMVQSPFEQHRQNVAIRKDSQDMNMTTPSYTQIHIHVYIMILLCAQSFEKTVSFILAST